MTITLDVGSRLNNFTLANAIYETCKKDPIVRLDPEAIAEMLMAQVNGDSKIIYDTMGE